MKHTRYICRHCGKFIAGQPPEGSDGSLDVLRTHRNKAGARCIGSRDEGKELAPDAATNARKAKKSGRFVLGDRILHSFLGFGDFEHYGADSGECWVKFDDGTGESQRVTTAFARLAP